MYDEAIKIDPKYANAYYNKGSNYLIDFNRNFAQKFIKILASHRDV